MKKLAIVWVLFALISATAWSATAVQVDFLISGLRDPFTDEFLTSGLIYTYGAGTTASKTTWTSAAMTTPNTNPVVLNAYGQALVFASGKYKFVIKNSVGTTLWTIDNLEYNSLATFASDTSDPFGPNLTQTNLIVNALAASLSTNLNAAGHRIINLATPTAATDAANRGWVDVFGASQTLLFNAGLASTNANLASTDVNLASMSASFTIQFASAAASCASNLASLSASFSLQLASMSASFTIQIASVVADLASMSASFTVQLASLVIDLDAELASMTASFTDQFASIAAELDLVDVKLASTTASLTLILNAPRWQLFTVTGTWTCPIGITTVYVTGAGGGGGGSAGSFTDTLMFGGGGGGGGEAIQKSGLSVSPGASYSVTIGLGGASGSYTVLQADSPQDGGSTYITPTGSSTLLVVLSGGAGAATYLGGGGGNNGARGGWGSGIQLYVGGWATGGAGGGNIAGGIGIPSNNLNCDGLRGSGGAGGICTSNAGMTGGDGGDGFILLEW